MKKIVTILTAVMLTALLGELSTVQAQEKKLSKEDFQQKQKEFITDCVGFTESEADKFFPLYFELQNKKNELNRKSWDYMLKAKDKELTEEEYDDIVENVSKISIECDELEIEYRRKFKQFLSSKKIFLVMRAEMRFHREFLRDAKDKRGPKGGGPQPR